jgi:ABC-2 type transport system permease protein
MINKLLAFLKKDFIIDISYKLFFIIKFVNIFLGVVVYYFLSKLIGFDASKYISNYSLDYFSYVIIGIAFSGYLNTAINTLSESLKDAQNTGTLEFMLSTPTSIILFLFGSSLWSFIVKSFDVIIYFVFGIFVFGLKLNNINFLSTILITILTVLSFISFGIFGASLVILYKRDFSGWINSVFRFLGGVYFPITIFPIGIKVFSYLMPVTYALDGLRLALLKGYSISQLTANILVLSLFIIILTPLSIYFFKFSINKAKKDGTLTEF